MPSRRLTPEEQALLEEYSQWLEANAYMDSDWWGETPGSIQLFDNERHHA